MERCFEATKESEFFKDYEKYVSLELKQKEVVRKFFNEKGIEADEYLVGGDGTINQSFPEEWKSRIILSIVPTTKDIEAFGTKLTKPRNDGLRDFKRNSAISKEFAQRCVDEKVAINLHYPRPRNYFKSLRNAYRWEMFKYKEKYYLRVQSECLKENDTPQGFKEIKLSEYHLLKEKFNEQE